MQSGMVKANEQPLRGMKRSRHVLCSPIDQDDRTATVPIKDDNCSPDSSDSSAQKDKETSEMLDTTLSAINTQTHNINDLTNNCPYHGPILRSCNHLTNEQDQSPMQRYLTEGNTVQPSLFIGFDGRVSICKGCTCWKVINATCT